jgi:hypothetical protein
LLPQWHTRSRAVLVQANAKRKNDFLKQPVELALYVEQSILFLLYRIVDTCEWSDVAFNIHQLRASEQMFLVDAPGNHAQVRLTLVNADSGIILAKRMLSIGPAITQALRHTLQEQMNTPCSRTDYESQVKLIYTKYLDSDAMLKAAWMMETANSDASIN